MLINIDEVDKKYTPQVESVATTPLRGYVSSNTPDNKKDGDAVGKALSA